jgi:hypothetical protein
MKWGGRMRLLMIAAGLAMAGCASTGAPVVESAALTPLNQAATEIGSPKIDYISGGTGAGQVTVHMPDGETLSGHYKYAEEGGFVTGENTALGPTGIISADGTAYFADSGNNVWVSASGPKTRLTCDAQLGLGHGEGICKTNTGAAYRLAY